MKTRRFHVYAGQEDLQDILKEFQEKFDVYYVPAYSDKGPVSFRDATSLEGLGTNVSGSHLGNRQVLAFMDTTVCLWREYRWADYEKSGTRHTSLCEGNTERIDIDLNGVYQGKAIFPTQIAAMHYENETAKRLYDGLKRIVRGSTGPHWEVQKIPYEEVRQLLALENGCQLYLLFLPLAVIRPEETDSARREIGAQMGKYFPESLCRSVSGCIAAGSAPEGRFHA